MKWIAALLLVLGVIFSAGTIALMSSIREDIVPPVLGVIFLLGIVMGLGGGFWLIGMMFAAI